MKEKVARTPVKGLLVIGATVLLSACTVTPKPLDEAEFKQKSQEDYSLLFQESGESVSEPLGLDDVINRIIRYNLDAKAKAYDTALALGATSLDTWDMLPRTVVEAGYTNRSHFKSTNSISSSSYSYSDERVQWTSDLSFTWNVLDFGVSYFKARQNADRVLIAEERRRKALHNLVQEGQVAFWRAAVAQILHDEVRDSVQEAEEALENLRLSSAAGLRNEVEALTLQKTLLETLRQLEQMNNSLSNAKIELATLINLPPASEFTLDIPEISAEALPDIALDIATMEEMALVNNPAIREEIYQERITSQEVRKTLLRFLPGIEFSFDRKYESNRFLDDNRWNEYGMRVTWNIFNILSGPTRLKYNQNEIDVVRARRLAVRMAILAQLYVSKVGFESDKKNFVRAHQLWLIERKLSDHSNFRSQNNSESIVDSIVKHTAALTAEMRRYQAYAQLKGSHASLYSTLGLDDFALGGLGFNIEKLLSEEEVEEELQKIKGPQQEG